MSRPRHQFYNEAVVARQAVTIPVRLRKELKASRTWALKDVIGELIREPAHCPHVADAMHPVAVYGYGPEKLRDYEEALGILADRQREAYELGGKKHERAMRKTTPIVLSAVASYPEPDMQDTHERRKWVGLVVDAARARWKRRLRSVIAHGDESFYHLHLIVDNVGASAKNLHMGHARALAEPSKSAKGAAYRQGCVSAQDWYFEAVSKPMGWARYSQAPRPRVGRSKALRDRQAELEAYEAQLDAMALRLKAAEKELLLMSGVPAAAVEDGFDDLPF